MQVIDRIASPVSATRPLAAARGVLRMLGRLIRRIRPESDAISLPAVSAEWLGEHEAESAKHGKRS